MRKCNATVIFNNRNYQLYTIIVHSHGNNITLLDTIEEKYIFSTFTELYDCALAIMKNNGFYTEKKLDFGAEFYDIFFINSEKPITLKGVYGYRQKKNNK